MSNEYYNIEKILDRKKVNGKIHYKIKWEGYPMDQCTWEPLENLENVKALVDEYNQNHSTKNNPPKGKKTNTLLNKKRKEEIKQKNHENENNLKQIKTQIKKNNKEPSYKIDNSLKNVVTVKKQDETMMALVDKIEKNEELVKEFISTEELRRRNPWILLDFYESKIKFT